MLVKYLRRWPSIKPTFKQRPVAKVGTCRVGPIVISVIGITLGWSKKDYAYKTMDEGSFNFTAE